MKSDPSFSSSQPTFPAPATTEPTRLPEGTGERPDAELTRLRAALEEARSELHAAREEQDRFLTSISHELRTPLSAILLWASLIEEEKLVEPDQLHEAVDAIRRSAEEQQALVQNLVDTARILSGRLRLELQPTPISAIVHTTMERAEAAARDKHITLTPPVIAEDVRVLADRERLQQALGFLLSNAVKFTPESGRVTITARREGDLVALSIADTGVGLAPEAIPGAFDGPQMHRRLAARTESGLGFGLVLARRLVELHEGSIRAESPGVGQGATFTVRLRLAP